jgi:K+-transporting ATPase ATPase B chain
MAHPPSHSRPLFERAIVKGAIVDAFSKLDPRRMVRNPVMFVVEVGSAFTTLLFAHAAITGEGDAPPTFILAVALWLWFTVLFANFAEAMAEGRGKAQADTLRKARQDVTARRLRRGEADPHVLADAARRDAVLEPTPSSTLRIDDIVFITAGDLIPADGEIIEGM